MNKEAFAMKCAGKQNYIIIISFVSLVPLSLYLTSIISQKMCSFCSSIFELTISFF